ncbi:MAG: AmmeMemoRadiSam system protein A [Nanoarchaeota archaeon]|nr:AmmeMemoRadiSam system protein A [Nanoarchaeota archaeon]MBU0962897.1 AmmeMemoRadiSam system protein A [Nanoarchaeota archaeon]
MNIDGKELLKLARNSIESFFDNKEIKTENFKEKKGVFVTLYTDNKVRGCIGFIEPNSSLGVHVIKAARLAAFQDPRFPPLKKNEKFRIEISVLTKPELIKEKEPEKILKNIEINKDGLIISYKGYNGLLLPQVATENNLSKEEFLEAVCNKAGLQGISWKTGKCTLFKFQAEIFKE